MQEAVVLGGVQDRLELLGVRRVGVRREHREFTANGPDVRHLALADCAEDAGVLLAGHQQDHGHDQDGIDAMTALLKRQAAAMGSAARVVAACDGPRMAGFCLYYHYASTTWIRAVAVDRTRAAPHLYFNLMYYLPIQDAYAHGSTALHAGMTTVEAKRRRGAVVTGLTPWPTGSGRPRRHETGTRSGGARRKVYLGTPRFGSHVQGPAGPLTAESVRGVTSTPRTGPRGGQTACRSTNSTSSRPTSRGVGGRRGRHGRRKQGCSSRSPSLRRGCAEPSSPRPAFRPRWCN
ncbi:hypothetical protein ACFV0H_17165 [Streptomyces erythrochromogenes]|uniref:hypothetical protein n=1 Tax=Streptomyces erythrochromogenes TaxID=285574 RepID=UPI0036AB3E14